MKKYITAGVVCLITCSALFAKPASSTIENGPMTADSGQYLLDSNGDWEMILVDYDGDGQYDETIWGDTDYDLHVTTVGFAILLHASENAQDYFPSGTTFLSCNGANTGGLNRGGALGPFVVLSMTPIPSISID